MNHRPRLSPEALASLRGRRGRTRSRLEEVLRYHVKGAVLVDTGRTGELQEVLDGFAAHWADRVRLRLLGPMASYDFVLTPGAGGG